MKEIKEMWAALSDREQCEYEKKADYVSTQIKAKKFKETSLHDK